MKPKRFEYKGKEYEVYVNTSSANSLLWIDIYEKTNRKFFGKWKHIGDEVTSLGENETVIDIVLNKIDELREKEKETEKRKIALDNWNTWQGGKIDE